MTLTLAIDTATPQVGLALAGREGIAGELRLNAGRRHGETLTPAIQSLLSFAGVGLEDVSRLAVDIGPGLFTGLRVGVATAKALGSALGLPVVPCTSLDVLAHSVAWLGRPVAAVVDARRGEVFWARYEPAGDAMTQVTEPAVASPDTMAASIEKDVLLLGDGARRYFPDRATAGERYDHPSAAALADLAARAGEAVPVDAITPLYLRGADVRIGWEQR